jgi:hypothetical protein
MLSHIIKVVASTCNWVLNTYNGNNVKKFLKIYNINITGYCYGVVSYKAFHATATIFWYTVLSIWVLIIPNSSTRVLFSPQININKKDQYQGCLRCVTIAAWAITLHQQSLISYVKRSTYLCVSYGGSGDRMRHGSSYHKTHIYSSSLQYGCDGEL